MATTNYSWNLPTVGGSEDTWGTSLNANWTALDTLLGGVSAAEFAVLDGLTATTAELNLLDGVTATTAELNILDGVTSTTAELNLLDGVTWTLTDYNTLTATAAELNILDGLTGIASQAEAEAGTATDKLMTPERTKEAIDALVSPDLEFVSAEQTISAGGSLTIPHGLGAAPDRMPQVWLVCKSAQHGYSVGDKISDIFLESASSIARGANVAVDDTNIKVRFANVSLPFRIMSLSGGTAVELTNSSWRLVVGI